MAATDNDSLIVNWIGAVTVTLVICAFLAFTFWLIYQGADHNRLKDARKTEAYMARGCVEALTEVVNRPPQIVWNCP